MVVRAERTGRPWRDPLGELDRAVARTERYHRTVDAFGTALDGDPDSAAATLAAMPPPESDEDPDVLLWSATVFALAGRAREASALFNELTKRAPQFVEAAYRFCEAGLLNDPQRLSQVLPPRP